MLAVLYCFLISFTCVPAGNIFAIVMFPSKSHFASVDRLLRSLAEKGHYVDVATHYTTNNTPPTYNQISLLGSLPIRNNNLPVQFLQDASTYETMSFITKKAGIEACEAILQLPQLESLKYEKRRYDLAVIQIFGSDCMLGFAHIFNTTVAGIVTTASWPWAGDRIGNPDNPAYIPNFFVYSTQHMTFYERLENTVFSIYTKFLYYYMSPKKSNEIARNFFTPALPPLENIARKTSLLLMNSHYSINNAKPVLPNFVEMAGLHINKPQKLSISFEKVFNSSREGIIYLSMGSNLMSETFELEKLQAMFDAFAELPHTVLWKADSTKFSQELRIPKNIHFEKWMPQLDILCHDNVKLFISHGGLLGTQEAVFCGVPRLGIPFYADQESNIRDSEKMGIAIRVAYKDISKESILSNAKKLLEDSSYRKNAKRISEIFKDRPLSPLEATVHWMEYIMKHKMVTDLIIVANMSLYEYFLADVALVTSVTAVTFYILISVSRRMFSMANHSTL